MNKYFVGYDLIANKLLELANTTSYPPFNIRKLDEQSYTIELAVAGFPKSAFSIESSKGILTIKAEKLNEENKNFIHKGITSKGFTRSFSLADNIEVGIARFRDGILSVELHTIPPKDEQTKKVDII